MTTEGVWFFRCLTFSFSLFKRVTDLILKKMESTYPQFCVFEKELYKFKDIKNVHYILSLICFSN